MLNVAMWFVVCLQGQDDPGAIVERLRAESVVEREEAGRALAALGETARPAVEKGAKSSDPELAQRAAEILRLLDFRKAVPPRLKAAFRGIEDRLASGGDPVWTQAFLEALGYRSRGDVLRFPDFLEPGDLNFLVVRALRGAGSDQDNSTPLAEENPVLRAAGRFNLRAAIPEMVALLGHPNPSLSSLYIESELLELDAREGIPALVVRLAEDRWDDSVRVLKSLGAAEALPLLVPLLRSTRSKVRTRAAEVLGTCGSQEAVPALLPLLRDPDAGVCLFAASALGSLGAKEALPALVELVVDPKRNVQAAAVMVISKLGLKEAIPALLKAVKTPQKVDDEPDLIFALGELGAREAAPLLRRLIGDREFTFRERALRVLVQLVGREAAPEIVANLEDPDLGVRGEAITSMERLVLTERAPALVPLLKDDDPAIQVTAALALVRLGTKSSLEYFVKFLSDVQKDVDDRSMVTFLLGREGFRESAPILREIVRDGQAVEKLRVAAAGALADLGATEAVQDLRMAIVAGGGELRASGIAALGRLKAREAIPDLERALSDPESDFRVKQSAALALGGMKALSAVSLLRQALDGEEIPGSAALALAEMGIQEAVPGILKLLEKKDLRVCSQAADALSRLAPGAGVSRLKELLRSGSRTARAAAAVALSRLGAPEGIPALLEASQCDSSIPLCSLNAIRSPRIWALLRESRRPYPFYGLPDHRGEAGIGMIGLQAMEPKGMVRVSWAPVQNGGLDSPLALLEGFEFSFILEEDRVRLPQRYQARRFWREWGRKEVQKVPAEK